MTTEVLVSNHGGANTRRLPVVGVSCNWELSAPGSFSAFARVDDLRRAGLGFGISGMWVTCDLGSAGVWGGVVAGKPAERGITEIAAEGWATLLRGQAIETYDRPVSGQPGGIARLALQALSSDQPAYITVGSVEEGGVPVTMALGGQDVFEVLSQLSDDTEMEWMVDADRVLHIGRALGRDVSSGTRLVEGVQIVDFRVNDDAWTRSAAELLSIEGNEERIWRAGSEAVTTRSRQVVSRTARRRIRRKRGKRDRWRPGRRVVSFVEEEVISFAGPTSEMAEVSSNQVAGVGLHSLAIPAGLSDDVVTSPMELTLADVDGAWQRCQPGNVVRVLIGSIGFSGWLRVVVRGYEAQANELTIAGEALSDRRAVL